MTLEERYQSLTLQDIQTWIDDGQEEDVHLEFKQLRGKSFGEKDKENADRENSDNVNFAKGLSSFANADGGIMVWGVATTKVGGADRATSLRLVPDARGLAARLSELEGGFASPRIDGVQHRALVIDPGKEGIVLTLIPRSEFPPHMAKAGLNRYYKRSGSNTYTMEHFDLEDMFGRRPRPQLGARVALEASFNNGTHQRATALLTIRLVCENRGKGYAQFPSVALSEPEGRPVTDYLGRLGGPVVPVSAPTGWWLRWNRGADVVVYPDDELELTFVTLEYSNSMSAADDVRFRSRVMAANAPAVESEHVIKGEEIFPKLVRVFEEAGFFCPG